MKKWMVILALSLTACGTTDINEEPDSSEEVSNDPAESSSFSGFVMDQNEDSILVVDLIENRGGAPIWVSGVEKDMWLGKKVEVEIVGPIAESTPMQGQAGEVTVVESNQPKGADLNESEALASALSEVDRGNALSVETMEYNDEEDQWTIKMRSTVTESGTERVTVDDDDFEQE
ncbi:YobA family protein [Halobacillus sp. A1]|uniref:DUF3221 domain-containing protein n=1 Tax=Halobacillus sp. A1 TaxID=2880262 RepID=UPI0020A6D6B5|nr:DUF3221 domain-containing protein [Halobacillus sp. A1]MCP3030909.1 YobA family protein [Halobacillus sp. A1]